MRPWPLCVALAGCAFEPPALEPTDGATPADALVADASATRDAPPGCGDGILGDGEACDDGDPDDLDGCRSDCTAARCGDGVTRRAVEDCDDGNTADGDGCSALCRRCPGDDEVMAFVYPDNHHCYQRHGAGRSWLAARDACWAAGASLAIYEDLDENDAVLAGTGGAGIAWLGLSDIESEDVWLGVDGEPDPYLNFDTAVGEPSNSGIDGEDCVEQDANRDGRWNDDVCAEAKPYLCETGGWAGGPDQHAYRVFHEPRDWEAARTGCRAIGADLVVVDTPDENEILAGLLHGSHWIGLSDQGKEGAWRWVDGTRIGYESWDSSEPDGGGAGSLVDCVYMGGGGDWSDDDCSDLRGFVCEVD